MKKCCVALGILLFSSVVTTTAYAGSLNQYEVEIVEAAKQTYKYNGMSYHVEKEYLDQLISYLSADGMDLTEEQKDEVIQAAYGSIERGVLDGYLVPVQALDEVTPTVNPEQTSSKDATPVEGDTLIADITDADTSETGGMNTAPEADTDNTDQEEAVATVGNDSSSDTPMSPVDLIEEIINAEEEAALASDGTDNEDGSIFDALNNIDKEDNSIIKETGFDLSNTIIVSVGMGLLMMIGIIVTVKTKFFAQADA